MKETSILNRLQGTGGDKWELHLKARELVGKGQDIIELTIGEPDVATPSKLVDVANEAMLKGRTTYSNGRGEPGLRDALATHYTTTRGRTFSAQNFLCFPGTQTSLFAVLMGIAETGDEVLVGDPMYATYEGVIRASGARVVPVPLRPENGFRISVEDMRARVSDKTSAILLTTPHNPTGAILTETDIAEIGAFAKEHDLWVVSDEVYDQLVFEGNEFHSPLAYDAMSERTIAVSSISKSHAAPGFRSGWCVGPSDFIERLLPLSEAMLFGNQPFIADMTEAAIRDGSSVAEGMCQRFATRAHLLSKSLSQQTGLKVVMPQAGMFAMVDVSETGLSGRDYAFDLLEKFNVAVMPGISFGTTVENWVRVALTIDDDQFEEACRRIINHAQSFKGAAA